MWIARLELNPQSYLSFTPKQVLQRLAERYGHFLELFHSGWVRTIEQIEKLEDGANPDPFLDGKSLGEPHVQIGIGRCLKVVPTG
jgi:hypothetical protein